MIKKVIEKFLGFLFYNRPRLKHLLVLGLRGKFKVAYKQYRSFNLSIFATKLETRRRDRRKYKDNLRKRGIPLSMRKAGAKKKTILYERDGNRCKLCNKSFKVKDLTVDHIIPITKGGKGGLNNLQLLCGLCNTRKGDKLPWEMHYAWNKPFKEKLSPEEIFKAMDKRV